MVKNKKNGVGKLSNDHASRLAYLEANVDHLSEVQAQLIEQVTQLGQHTDKGFSELREVIKETEQAAEKREGRLEGKITQFVEKLEQHSETLETRQSKYEQASASRRIIPTPVVFAFIMCMFALITGFSVYVQLTQAPLAKDVIETRGDLDFHRQQGGYPDALVMHAEQRAEIASVKSAYVEDAKNREEQLDALESRVDDLNSANRYFHGRMDVQVEHLEAQVIKNEQRTFDQVLFSAGDHAKLHGEIGKAQEAIQALQKGQGDRFFGRDGDRLEGRVNRLENSKMRRTERDVN